jgi:hypothetical protein
MSTHVRVTCVSHKYCSPDDGPYGAEHIGDYNDVQTILQTNYSKCILLDF